MSAILAGLLKVIFGDLTGKLADAYKAKLEAANETERLIADTAIADIERQKEAQAAAKEVRLSSGSFWEIRTAVGLVAISTACHYAAIVLDSLGHFAWNVAAMPAPFADYEGVILLSFFGVMGLQSAVGTIASAIRGRR